MSDGTLNTRAEAISKQPWCETCGKDVPEVLCPTCAKWWHDNPPPSPGYERGQRETVALIVAWLRKCQKAKLNHHAEVCHREDDDVLDAIVTAMNTFAYAADAIEAGEWK